MIKMCLKLSVRSQARAFYGNFVVFALIVCYYFARGSGGEVLYVFLARLPITPCAFMEKLWSHAQIFSGDYFPAQAYISLTE